MRTREIFFFWLPLFASWLLMTAEGPLLSAAVNRLPNEVVMLAALGIVFSLAVTIESPVIHLLATTTALVHDYDSFRLVRRFTLHCMLLVIVLGALLALTPLFHLVVERWMGTPAEVAHWVQRGLIILIPWSAAIAWRRFLQGILIRFNQTRKIARATLWRLVTTGATALALLYWSDWAGITLAATAMMAGVVFEALYVTVIVQPLLVNELSPMRAKAHTNSDESTEPPLTYRRLLAFHLPLAATAAITLLAQPLVTFALARLEQPTLTLAAWPLIFQAMLVMRAAALALPEVVIALSKEGGSKAMARFCLGLTAASFALMVLLVTTPLAEFYLVSLQDAAPDIIAMAQHGLLLFVPLPALAILVAWVRGLLIQQRATRIVNDGMLVNLTVTVALLALGIHLDWPGIDTAAVAIETAIVIQLFYLVWRWRRLATNS